MLQTDPNDTKMETKCCGRCGLEWPSEKVGELCPACLLESGLGGESMDSIDSAERDRGRKLEPDAPTSLQPPIRDFGNYELIAEIARGGQGVVYRARHKSLGRIVALKMIGLGAWATEKNLKRFRAEAEAAANLDHPQIVPIYEIGQVENQHYFTMKLIEGRSLKELVADGPLAPRTAAELVATLACAIQHAHQRGILHRDLKPGNILLDAHEVPYLTDFGLAKLIEEEGAITQTVDLLGTPSYMSPEQAAGDSKKVTCATDVYGLGTVLYELLTGNAPFAGGTSFETIRQVLQTEPHPIRFWNPKADHDLETICLKCLEKDPAKRFASARALHEDLQRWLRHEPIQARPVGPLPRAFKWVRRNRAPALAVAAIVALVAALSVIASQRRAVRKFALEPTRSLAIVMRSGETNAVFLAKDWSRDLNHLFSRLSGLRTIGRTPALKWESTTEPIQTIGRALGASAVLLGELHQEDQRIRLDMELMTFPNQTRIWSRRLTLPVEDWDYLRTEIAREVVTRLSLSPGEAGLALLRRPFSKNQAALSAYYRGRHNVDVLDDMALREAITNFETAIQLDPRFAQAHAGLGEAYMSLTLTDHAPGPLMAKAREEIRVALEIDPQLPEGKVVDGMLRFFSDWDWKGAAESLDEASRLDLSLVEGNACYLHMRDIYGQGEESLNEIQIAVALHPSSPAIQGELGCSAYYAGLFDSAESYSREMLKNDPENAATYFQLARTLAQKSNYQAALEILKIGKTKPGGNWSALDAESAYVHAREGNTNAAQEIIAALKSRGQTEYIDPYIYAMIYAGLRDTNLVFEFLNKACDSKSTWIPSLPCEPKFAEYRTVPDYPRLLDRMKITGSRKPVRK
jgi:TolB-like protein/tetratricopeptide (TPR) repeat protein